MLNFHNSYSVKNYLFIIVLLILIQIIMTTKEFNRKVSYFKSLDLACGCFQDSCNSFIYEVSLIDSKGFKHLNYVIKPSGFFPHLLSNDCKSLFFEQFSVEAFEIQLKYFISFYNSCTDFQRSNLRSNLDLCHLINLI